MSSINQNNLSFTSDRKRLKLGASYSASSNHTDSGEGVNVDLDHSLMLKCSKDIVISIRSELDQTWSDIAISAGEFYTIDVKSSDLMNYRLASPGERALIRVKSLNRSYDIDDSFEQRIDAAASFGRFKFLPKIIATAS